MIRRAVDVTLATAALCAMLPLVASLKLAGRRGRRRTVTLHGRYGRPVSYDAERLICGGMFAWINHWRVLGLLLRGELAWTGPRARLWGSVEPEYARLAWVPALVSPHSLKARLNIAHESAETTERQFAERAKVLDHLGLLGRFIFALALGARVERRRRPRPVSLLGLRIDNHTMASALEALGMAARGRGVTQVAFLNPHCFNVAARDPFYRDVVARAPLVLADGIGVHLALKWFTTDRLLDNVNGTDLFPHLCRMAAERGLRLYLLGGRPGVAMAVAEWAVRHAPALQVVGHHHGYWQSGEDEAVARDVGAARPDIVLVALGVPQQDVWIAANAARIGAPVIMGVGGLFDFYSGRMPRAPMWMRELGLEWLFRLIQEPRRMWRRYLIGNFTFLLRAAQHHGLGWLRR